MAPGRNTTTTILTASGQVTPAGSGGVLWGFTMRSDTSAANISFENEDGGTELWSHTMGATTAEGDNNDVVVFTKGIPFEKDIYCTIVNAPEVTVQWEPLI